MSEKAVFYLEVPLKSTTLALVLNFFSVRSILASFKKMKDQKVRKYIKEYESQQKQIAAMKKSGKSAKQANEEMKIRLQNKQNKGGKTKKGSSATIGDEGTFLLFCYLFNSFLFFFLLTFYH